MVEFPPEFPFVRRPRQTPPATPPRSDNPKPPSAPTPPSEPSAERPNEHPAADAAPVEIPLPAVPRKQFVERRKFRRDRLAAFALVHVDGAKVPPAKVSLVDISIAGARFHSTEQLDVGDRLQIRVEVGPFRWTTRMRVIHCTPHNGNSSLIGCAFLRTEILRPWPAAA